MPVAEEKELVSTAERLKAVLEQEPALRGENLIHAVREKQRLVEKLTRLLRLDQSGAAERAAGLKRYMAGLVEANGIATQFSRLRLQMSRLRVPSAKASPTHRVDITF